MAEIIADRVKETSTSTGTGDFTVSGALTGFRTFASQCAVGDTFSAAIVAVDANGAPTGAWEIGNYTYSAANTIARTTTTSSSNNNGYVNFAAGTKHVYIDLTAYQIKNLIGADTNPASMPYGQDSSLYTSLTFSDEFNTLALDTTKWNPAMWYETDNATKNYVVSNGSLNIWPQKDATNTFFPRSINTDGKFYQTYGFFEVEAQLPTGFGCLPSFWMMGRDTPNRPTANAFRAYSGGTTQVPPWANTSLRPIDYEALAYGGTNDTLLGQRRMRDTFATTDLSAGFHKYGLKWEPDGFTFYFDGAPVGTKITTTDSAIQNRMFLVLTLEYGAFSGDPNVLLNPKPPEGSTNALKINYVRAWQFLNAAPAPAPTPAPGVTMPFGRPDTSIYTAMTFEDDFLGTTLSNNWSRQLWYEGADNKANYRVDGNSNLKIWVEAPFSTTTANTQHNRTFTTDPTASGVSGGFVQKFGYYEARIKLPIGRGLWPGWWLYGHPFETGTDIDRPEIDIMEAYSGGGPGGAWSTSDWHPNNYATNLWMGVNSGASATHIGERKMWGDSSHADLPAVDLSAQFHVYGVMWEDDGVTTYFDGTPVGSKMMTTRFNQPLFLLLDLWLGSASGAPSADPSQTPLHETNSMWVDYVRVWQLKKYAT